MKLAPIYHIRKLIQIELIQYQELVKPKSLIHEFWDLPQFMLSWSVRKNCCRLHACQIQLIRYQELLRHEQVT